MQRKVSTSNVTNTSIGAMAGVSAGGASTEGHAADPVVVKVR